VRLAELAAEQHGVVSATQLRRCGLGDTAVRVRVRNGRLHRLHHGVYAVGHAAPTLHGRFLAAVLACGEGAVLSHRSAVALWGLMPWDERHPEVTVAGTAPRRRPGIRIHRSTTLDRRDVTRHEGIPVTAPARAILDVAGDLPPRAVRRLLREGQAQRRVNPRQVDDVLARGGRRPGAPVLRAALAEGPTPTRSELEDAVLGLIVGAGIERPKINAPLRLDGRRVVPDFLWTDRRLVVEADGRRWHETPAARRDDAERQAVLEAHGYRVLRVSWQQAIGQPDQTLARIHAAMERPGQQRHPAR
jgi:hypothetical protein